MIRAVIEDKRLLASYDVRLAIVCRPRAPQSVALRLLPSLRWRDLARIMDDMRLRPSLRTRAQQLLAGRLEEMTPGEQAALARIASRALVEKMRGSIDAKVIAALLCNPRLVEADVITIATSEETPAAALSAVARSERWAGRYRVKTSLATNPNCPSVDSLRSLQGLSARDLERIADDPAASRLVRLGASRRLSDRSRR